MPFSRSPKKKAAERRSAPASRHHAVHERGAAAADEVVGDAAGARPPPRSAPRAPTGARGARRAAGSTRSRVTRVGGESVSGYMRSGPGRIRSKSVVPSREGLARLVGDAVGRVHVAQADLVRRRVARRARAPTTTTRPSLVSAAGRGAQPREVLPRLPRPGLGVEEDRAAGRGRRSRARGRRARRRTCGPAASARRACPARPGRRTASTRKGPRPSSKPGRRPWLRTNHSHVSDRSGASDDEPTKPVTSVGLDPDVVAACGCRAGGARRAAAAGSPAARPRRGRAAGPSPPAARP